MQDRQQPRMIQLLYVMLHHRMTDHVKVNLPFDVGLAEVGV